MKLIVLDSGSAANGYILANESESLVIECGVRLSEAKKALGWRFNCVAALVSHEHMDHAAYVRDYEKAGLPVITTKEVVDKFGLRTRPSVFGKGYKQGGFSIVPFPVPHDVPCFGFLISHADCGKVLFVTDAFMTKYTFKGLNHVIVEANYADDLIKDEMIRNRLMGTHMEIGTVKAMLLANDLSQVRSIVLVHLSNLNSDAQRFEREIRAATGIPTQVARKGLIIEL